MDVEVILVSILRVVWEVGEIFMYEVRDRLSTGIVYLLYESLRVKNIFFRVDNLDDDSVVVIRRFCLIYYDIRVVVLDFVLRFDMMRYFGYLFRY